MVVCGPGRRKLDVEVSLDTARPVRVHLVIWGQPRIFSFQALKNNNFIKI